MAVQHFGESCAQYLGHNPSGTHGYPLWVEGTQKMCRLTSELEVANLAVN